MKSSFVLLSCLLFSTNSFARTMIYKSTVPLNTAKIQILDEKADLVTRCSWELGPFGASTEEVTKGLEIRKAGEKYELIIDEKISHTRPLFSFVKYCHGELQLKKIKAGKVIFSDNIILSLDPDKRELRQMDSNDVISYSVSLVDSNMLGAVSLLQYEKAEVLEAANDKITKMDKRAENYLMLNLARRNDVFNAIYLSDDKLDKIHSGESKLFCRQGTNTSLRTHFYEFMLFKKSETGNLFLKTFYTTNLPKNREMVERDFLEYDLGSDRVEDIMHKEDVKSNFPSYMNLYNYSMYEKNHGETLTDSDLLLERIMYPYIKGLDYTPVVFKKVGEQFYQGDYILRRSLTECKILENL